MRLFLLRLGWLGILAVLFATFSLAVPPHSYINRKVTSVNDLVLHVTTDPQVFSRYSRHFSMSREELIPFLSNLHLTKLPKDGLYVVYLADEQGMLKSKARMLKKGTPVFVDARNRATLMLVCGNPLTRGPKKDGSLISYNEPNTAISTDIAEVPVQMENEVEALTTVVPPEYAPADLTPSAVYTPPTVTYGGSDIQIVGGAFPWQILPAIGVIGAIGGGNNPPPPPVPEPASIAMLAIGATTLIVRRRKKS